MHKLVRFCKKVFTKTFFIIFFILLGLCLFFFWGWFEKQFDKGRGMYYVYKGDKEYKKSELQKAINYYNRGLNLYPEHYGAWFNLGNIYVVYEDYYSAAEAYENAIQYNKKFTLARMNLGIVSAEKLGDFDGAIAQYQEIIDARKRLWFIPFIFSNRKSEKINRGTAYYNMGIAYRQKSIFLTDDERSKTNMYLLKAIDAYSEAVKILKKDYDPTYNLALTYHLVGNYKNAGLNYCKAIGLEPMNYEAHYNLAILLRHLKKYKESLDELEKATILVTEGSYDNKSVYIFDVLNEVSRTLVITDEYKYLVENLEDTPGKKAPVTFIQGKIVASDELDRAILKNFRNCRSKHFFDDYE